MSKKPKTGNSPTERFFTVLQVAERWGVCDKTVRRRIDDEKLIAHRLGHALRISEADLLAYEAAHRLPD
jgi:excisionase family DNA binding protein